MTVRAKFFVTQKEHHGNSDLIRLSAVVSGSDENKQFFYATPSGSVEMYTVNPEAGEQFNVGDEFYIDFTKVDKA